MSVNQLWEKLIPGVKYKSAVTFSVESGQVVAIDFNCYFCELYSKPHNALLMTNNPEHTPNDIIKRLNHGMIE